MSAEERMYTREAGRLWWVVLLAGMLWLMLSVIILRMDITSIVSVGILIGAIFAFACVNEFIVGMNTSGGWKAIHWIVAFLFALGALWGFFQPVQTFFALASILGLLLAIQGIFEITRAFMTRDENDLWWLSLIAGILFLLLAFWVAGADRVYNMDERAELILFFAGFMCLFRGIAEIAVAFALHRGKKAAEAMDTGTASTAA
ncbi:MAG TPA: DUF308 domain-containing protein [Actinomycetota bacterium]|nr:DUF308 domain-containing protein [Actinomycetota bacterium]